MSCLSLPSVDFHNTIAAEVLSAVPRHIIHKYEILPFGMTDNILHIAASEKLPFHVLQELSFITGKNILPVILPHDRIWDGLRMHYGIQLHDASYGAEPQPEKNPVPEQTSDSLHRFGDSVVREINHVLEYAIRNNISDIHFEPCADHFRIRIRKDGRLTVLYHLPLRKQYPYISRLKVMAKLDITEKRRPQDGNMNHTMDQKQFDIRISSMPTDAGEKVVLRILDRSAINLELENLGFDAHFITNFKTALNQPYGLYIVTGPTGSGKTTTLYSALSYLNKEDINILTIEDPVEYVLEGINQSRARPDLGYTFAKALRTFLRQDPDVIMIGEIRDRETAEIAIRAALTGHIVLTTLHTNNALTAVYRLLDMGVEPFLICSTVKILIAQRLVRKICPNCKIIDEEGRSALETQSAFAVPSSVIFRRGQGCSHCSYSGFSGRTAIGEMIVWNDRFTDITVHGAHLSDFKKLIAAERLTTLWEDGVRKVHAGITSIHEINRETSFSF